MAIQVSKQNIGALRKLAERGERAMATVKKVKKEAEHVMEKVLRTGETTATSFGFGLLNGYHGPVTVAKIPLELVVAGVTELGGYIGLAGKHSDHLNNIGDGALSAFAVIKGVQIGAEMKAKHAAGSAAGQITTAKGHAALSQAEIRANIDAAVAANRQPVG